MRPARSLAAAAALCLAVVGLSACSADDDTAPDDAIPAAEPSEKAPEPVVEKEPEDEEPAAEADAADATDGSAAPWANPVTTGGDLLATLSGDGFTVDVYQVGVTQATRTGSFVTPDTNEPIIPVGSDIVFVNYVVTNTGSEPLSLGSSLIQVKGTYEDWPYLQGMDSVTDNALFEQMGVNTSAARPDSYVDPYVLAFEPGDSYSIGTNFAHQPGSPIVFTATFVPVDANGDLLHDARQEVTAQATIA